MTGSSISWVSKGASRRYKIDEPKPKNRGKQRLPRGGGGGGGGAKRRRAAGENPDQPGDQEKNPSWWKDMKSLPGAQADEKKDEKPWDLMTDEEKEEKKIRDKWGGTLAESGADLGPADAEHEGLHSPVPSDVFPLWRERALVEGLPAVREEPDAGQGC